MAVTTATYTGAYGGGFRAWVHVSYDNIIAPTGYEVLLLWDPAQADFASPGNGPRPSWVNAAGGLAVWVDVNLGAASDYEVHLTCKSGFTATALVTGTALHVGVFDGSKSQATWSCAS